MAKKPDTLSKLLKMAKDYGVDKNAMFVAAANQYALQMRVIETIKEAIDEEESLTTSKTYIKGETNTYASPLIRELPKHADSANRTAATMLDIIQKLGKKKENVSRLTELMRDD